MPSLTLRKRKALDATGQPLDPMRLYTPISPHARDHRVFNPELTVLRGDHEAVKAAPALWVTTDATSEERGAALQAYRAQRAATDRPDAPDPSATRILNPIPRERRVVALRNYHDRSGRIVHEGSLWDARDPFVQGNPDMFGPEAA